MDKSEIKTTKAPRPGGHYSQVNSWYSLMLCLFIVNFLGGGGQKCQQDDVHLGPTRNRPLDSPDC